MILSDDCLFSSSMGFADQKEGVVGPATSANLFSRLLWDHQGLQKKKIISNLKLLVALLFNLK